MNEYANGKVYRLLCGGLVYYGSTIQTLTERLYHHNSIGNTCSSKILYEIGDEVKIELVEEYPCNSKRELELREQYYISNFECVNLQNAFLTKEERKKYMELFLKDYYLKNSKIIKNRASEYYNLNKEEISKKSKEKYDINKEEILRRRKEKYQANKEEINKKRRDKKKIKDIL
jgi:hypothetical protein